jgi:polyribonucleotide nucleotidyltransferase
MRDDDFENEDYKVGYRKPPKDGRFQKGTSGNPSGRPKKASDIGSELIREARAPLTINENGKRKVIKKVQGVAKQLMNKALTGNLPAARLLIDLLRQALDKVAEEERNCPFNRPADELTNDELLWIIKTGNEQTIKAEFEKHIRPKLEKSLRAKLEKSIRAELKKSMRAELEKSIRAEIEAAIRDGANGRGPRNRRKIGN